MMMLPRGDSPEGHHSAVVFESDNLSTLGKLQTDGGRLVRVVMGGTVTV